MTMTTRLHRAIELFDDGLVHRVDYTVFQVAQHRIIVTKGQDWLHCTCEWAHWRTEAGTMLHTDPCAHTIAAGIAARRGVRPRLRARLRAGLVKRLRLRKLRGWLTDVS